MSVNKNDFEGTNKVILLAHFGHEASTALVKYKEYPEKWPNKTKKLIYPAIIQFSCGAFFLICANTEESTRLRPTSPNCALILM